MTLHKRKKNSKWLEWLVVLVFVSVLGWYFYLKPPSLKRGEVTNVTIRLAEAGVSDSVTAGPECAKIYKALLQARPRSDHKCMTVGYITLHYRDGTTETVGILPGHDLDRYDLRHKGTCYYLPRKQFFDVLNGAGVDTSKFPKLDGDVPSLAPPIQ